MILTTPRYLCRWVKKGFAKRFAPEKGRGDQGIEFPIRPSRFPYSAL
jgi:hypothetical protein